MGQSPNGETINQINGIEFHQGKLYFSDIFVQSSNVYTSEPKKMAEKDSILLCVRAPVGIVNIVTRSVCIGRGLCALKPKKGNSKFYFYWLQTYKIYLNVKQQEPHSRRSLLKLLRTSVLHFLH